MNIGMLWFDNRKDPLDAKIARAAEYYKSKYGTTPTLCFVHPSAMPGDPEQQHVGLTVRRSRAVPRNHFWLGIATSLSEVPFDGEVAETGG